MQTKAQNTEKGMYVGLKQPRGDGERYVTPTRAAAKETSQMLTRFRTFTACKKSRFGFKRGKKA